MYNHTVDRQTGNSLTLYQQMQIILKRLAVAAEVISK